MRTFYDILVPTKGKLEGTLLTGGTDCEKTLDFNTALIQAGLGQYVKHNSSRPYGTRFQSSSKQRYAPITLNAPRTAVWSEYVGHSSQCRNTWSSAHFKALHEYSQQVFNNLEAQLREYYSRGSW